MSAPGYSQAEMNRYHDDKNPAWKKILAWVILVAALAGWEVGAWLVSGWAATLGLPLACAGAAALYAVAWALGTVADL